MYKLTPRYKIDKRFHSGRTTGWMDQINACRRAERFAMNQINTRHRTERFVMDQINTRPFVLKKSIQYCFDKNLSIALIS